MSNASSKFTRAVTRIRTEGLSTLPGWALRWVYWNGGLHRLRANPRAEKIARAYKYYKPRKKYGIQNPIVIFQMGKVGSTAIYTSLLALDLDVPIYHIHILTDLDALEAFARETCADPTAHLNQIKLARRAHQEIFGGRWKSWNVISLTRDPVKRTVSAFFESIGDFIPDFFERAERNAITLDELTAVFLHRYYHNSARDWFDAQLKPVFGIDVFAHEFPNARGYAIYEQGQTRLLVLRLEDLNVRIREAISEFLRVPNFELVPLNVGEEKRYGGWYREFVRNVQLPPAYLDEMYSTRYVQHFYSPEEIAEFRRFWERGHSVAPEPQLVISRDVHPTPSGNGQTAERHTPNVRATIEAIPHQHQAKRRARLIAFYLPQFHPIPENDAWWGKGFTEWRNVVQAKPLFPGHYQPHLPADLGFYDLRVPETRAAQAELARAHGIEGFCYWHYWFAGKRLLERPFNEVLTSGEPDLAFCLAWANQSWSGIWHGAPDRVLIEQTYPGIQDYTHHFLALLDAFGDARYMTIHGKQIFLVYRPHELPDPLRFTDHWRELAHRAGLKGLYFIGIADKAWVPAEHGFDACTLSEPGSMNYYLPKQILKARLDQRARKKFLQTFFHRTFPLPTIYLYKDLNEYPILNEADDNFPCVLPNWDNTPRSGIKGYLFHDSTPEFFGTHLQNALNQVAARASDERIIFIKSWNEWAEGNHLEPDQKFGKAYLQVTRDAVFHPAQLTATAEIPPAQESAAFTQQ